MIRFPCWFTFPSSFKLFLTSKHTIRPFIKVRFQLLFVHKLETRPTKENSDAYFNLLSDTTDSFLLKNKILCLERILRWPKSFFFSTFFFYLSNRYERRSFSSLYYRPYGTILAANKTGVLSGSPLSKTTHGCVRRIDDNKYNKVPIKDPLVNTKWERMEIYSFSFQIDIDKNFFGIIYIEFCELYRIIQRLIQPFSL